LQDDVTACITGIIARRDRMFLGMQDYSFAQIQSLCPNSTRFAQI